MPAKQGFAEALIAWQEKAGRHELPWQNTTDAYRIWLSEIMLQQTQVAAVIPYYLRFLKRFPDVTSLAGASADEVMHLWSGLGYYSRARNLHACAQHLVAEFGGVFPEQPEAIAQLPGIGPSTAAAIAAFAFGRRAAILDGNVKRVLCRVFAVAGYPGERAVEQQLWQLARDLLPGGDSDIRAYTQGLMDLGATLCKPKNPDCGGCPMRLSCAALEQGRIAELPTPKPRKAIPQRAVAMLLLRVGSEILLERRPPSGIWGGLWSLPECEAEVGEAEIRAFARAYGAVERIQAVPPFVHVFTHFRLTAQPYLVTLKARQPMLADVTAPLQWMALHKTREIGLPAPIKTLLGSLTLDAI